MWNIVKERAGDCRSARGRCLARTLRRSVGRSVGRSVDYCMPNQDGILPIDPGGQLRVERVAEDRRGAGVGVDRGAVVRAQFAPSGGAQAVAGPLLLGQALL